MDTIKQAYDDAKKEHEDVKANLKRLVDLRSGAEPKWHGELAYWEGKETDPEDAEKTWRERQIRQKLVAPTLQDLARKLPAQTGNDFVTRALGT